MNIITAYPVIMGRKVIANKNAADTLNFLNADGDPKILDGLSTPQVKSFQDWMDVKYPKWVNGKNLNKGSGYGSKGPSTKAAWKTYGEEWYKSAMALAGALGQVLGGVPDSAPATIPAKDTSAAQQEKMKKLGYFFDKAKGVYAKGKELGLFDGILNRLGLGGGTPQDQTQISTTPTGEVLPPPTGMSKTMKIVLIAGGALALVAIILVATKSNGKGK